MTDTRFDSHSIGADPYDDEMAWRSSKADAVSDMDFERELHAKMAVYDDKSAAERAACAQDIAPCGDHQFLGYCQCRTAVACLSGTPCAERTSLGVCRCKRHMAGQS